jgi:hypothetical protein
MRCNRYPVAALLSPHYRLDFDFEVIAFYHGAKQPFARHDQ